MRTNKEKYDFYMRQFDALVSEFVIKQYPHGFPDKFFEVLKFDIRECSILGARVYGYFYDLEKPKRTDIEKIKKFLKGHVEFSRSDIRFDYQYHYGDYSISGTISESQIDNDKRKSFCREELIPLLERNIEKYTIKEGDIKCDYCGAAVKETEAETYTVVNHKMYGARGKTGRYCSGHGVYDQMAHEG